MTEILNYELPFQTAPCPDEVNVVIHCRRGGLLAGLRVCGGRAILPFKRALARALARSRERARCLLADLPKYGFNRVYFNFCLMISPQNFS